MVGPINEIQARHEASFEEMGEDAVRQLVALGHISEPKKLGHARLWLSRFDAARLEAEKSQETAFAARSVEATERAAAAAEAAAKAAREANRIAERANRTSLLAATAAGAAVVISILSLAFGGD